MSVRKVVLLVAGLVIALSAVAEVRGTNRRGDLNGDGEVNVGDLNLVLNDIMTGTSDLVQCDINSDGTVNVGDVNEVLNLILSPDVVHEPVEYISGTLPVMYINTNGYRTVNSKKHYWQGEYWLDPMGNEDVEAIGSEEQPLLLQIKGRGNLTWEAFSKKPYRIKLDKKQALCGMNKSKHWCLLAHADDVDGAFQRDEMGFYLSSLLGLEWTPSQRPVELVLNGDYMGLYWIAEKIRVDKERVDIIEQHDNETDPNNVTGGWLIEIDNHNDTPQLRLYEREDYLMRITPHSPEVLSQLQYNYLTNLIETINELLYVNDKNDCRWEQYIDIDELVKYYMVNECLDDTEAFSGSCFWHKDRGENTKLKAGPVWDFGSVCTHWWYSDSFNYFLYQSEPPYCHNHWIGEIAKFPHFQEKVRTLWHEIYPEKLEELRNHCVQQTEMLSPAIECDIRRWQYLFDKYYKKRLWIFLDQHWQFLDSQWSVHE